MSEPIAFPATTAAIGLPLLFAGQAQKEFFVNQAFAILDALSQRAVLASLDQPPATVSDGDCYRVAAPGAGVWSQYPDHLAIAIAGSWHFVAPTEGMQLFDRAAGQWLCFRSGWQTGAAPTAPVGGTVVDNEARAALGELIETLRSLGLIGSISA